MTRDDPTPAPKPRRNRPAACAAALALTLGTAAAATQPQQPRLGTRAVPLIEVDGLRFRDLDRNGRLDPYEDWRLPPEQRAADLVARMSLAEKAGAMMFGTLPTLGGGLGGGGAQATGYDLDKARALLGERHVNSLITRLRLEPQALAEQHNALQAIAEQGRLGIPLTLGSDPRNHFQYTAGASVQAGQFSVWPEATGLAAIGDPDTVRRFAAIARREYRAVGLHTTLSPMADLATEPRWPRINGTFGEDAALARRLVQAYVEGFQGGSDGVTRDGVASVVKHWVGYGAAAEQGFDSHNPYGRHAAFPGGNFAQHIVPFEGAFAAHVAGVMPTYSILRELVHEGHALDQVGAGFNRWLLTDLLRGRYGFDGVIVSDWLITADCTRACLEGSAPSQPFEVAMPWGVEHLSKLERYVLGVEAGLDQFGGSDEPELLVEAVRRGLLPESRLDASVARVMALKFRQGLFEDPFVEPRATAAVFSDPATRAAALDAQRRALVLLKNDAALLPLGHAPRKVFLHGIDAAAATAKGWAVVGDPAQAELAIVRLHTPFERLHPHHLFGTLQHEGNLAFEPGQEEFELVAGLAARGLPVVATVYLDRPAVLTALLPYTGALLGDFGVSDPALLDVLAGDAAPRGRLPFELPSSMAAVEAQLPDLPHDSADPLFGFGFGLDYAEAGAGRDR
ncbi:MAG: glycoside hydrolase family 3 N-terminal domain-containing protein [Pseudomonas sp.]